MKEQTCIIRVLFKDRLQPMEFKATDYGTITNQLWIDDTLGGRYYITLDQVLWYYISEYIGGK